MNNEMTLNTREMKLQYTIAQTVNAALRPLQLLTGYYSQVLERRVSTRQTLHLLQVQAAFVLTVFADMPVVLRLLSLGWLCGSLLACRRSLSD